MTIWQFLPFLRRHHFLILERDLEKPSTLRNKDGLYYNYYQNDSFELKLIIAIDTSAIVQAIEIKQ